MYFGFISGSIISQILKLVKYHYSPWIDWESSQRSGNEAKGYTFKANSDYHWRVWLFYMVLVIHSASFLERPWSLFFLQGVTSRAAAIEQTMEFGKTFNEVTDRDMHDDWAKFRELKKSLMIILKLGFVHHQRSYKKYLTKWTNWAKRFVSWKIEYQKT